MEEGASSQSGNNEADAYLKRALAFRTLGFLLFLGFPLLVILLIWLTEDVFSLSASEFIACVLLRLPFLGMLVGIGLLGGSIWYVFRAKRKDYLGILLMLCMLFILLVVGVFSLASLNTARSTSYGAAVKAEMSGLRAVAELYYDHDGRASYGIAGDCNTPNSVFTDLTTRAYIDSIRKRIGGRELRCFSDGQNYAVSTPLPQGPATRDIFCAIHKPKFSTYWCVDSQGHQMEVSRELNGTSCLLAR